jgi:sugar phosphate isomerase/epimerase
MKNRFGVVTSTYPNFNAQQAMEGVSSAGFKNIELASCPSYFEHVLPRPEEAKRKDVEKVLKECEKYGLEFYCIAGHTRFGQENDVENYKKVLDYAEMAGIRYMTTDVGEVKTEEDKRNFYEKIKQIADYAQTKNVTICLEMHGPWCNNGKTGAEIIRTVNHSNVKLNYDTGNVSLYGGVRPEKDLKNALPYMGFLHLKENGGGLKEWNFPAIGEGNNNWKKIFKMLKNYDGPISIEIEFDGEERTLDQINEAVKKSYDFLKDQGYME